MCTALRALGIGEGWIGREDDSGSEPLLRERARSAGALSATDLALLDRLRGGAVGSEAAAAVQAATGAVEKVRAALDAPRAGGRRSGSGSPAGEQ